MLAFNRHDRRLRNAETHHHHAGTGVFVKTVAHAERQRETFAYVGEASADVPVTATHAFDATHGTEPVFTSLQPIDDADLVRYIAHKLLRFAQIEALIDTVRGHAALHCGMGLVIGIVNAIEGRFDRMQQVALLLAQLSGVEAEPESFRGAQPNGLKIGSGCDVANPRRARLDEQTGREPFERTGLLGIRGAAPYDHVDGVRQRLVHQQLQHIRIRIQNVRNIRAHVQAPCNPAVTGQSSSHNRNLHRFSACIHRAYRPSA